MSRIFILAKRNIKETVRDPLSVCFCIVFPVAMLVIMQLFCLSLKVGEVPMFKIDNFAPGIAVFGYTFTMLTVSLSIAGDKNSAFMTRLYVSPIRPTEYYLSYLVSGIPVCIIQTLFFYAVALIFKLTVSVGLIVSLVYLLPSMIFYISCGILIGAVMKNEKQGGPITSLIITGSGMLGGIWLPIEDMGGTFLAVCKWLPFYGTVYPAKQAVSGNYKEIFPYIFITLFYTALCFIISAICYSRAKS